MKQVKKSMLLGYMVLVSLICGVASAASQNKPPFIPLTSAFKIGYTCGGTGLFAGIMGVICHEKDIWLPTARYKYTMLDRTPMQNKTAITSLWEQACRRQLKLSVRTVAVSLPILCTTLVTHIASKLLK